MSLEGVLTGPGGGQHRTASAVPGQPPLQVQIAVPLAAVRERAAETAVQDQDLLAGPAFVQLLEQPRRRNTGAAQLSLHGVSGGEVQAVAPVQHAVARQIHHHHIADAAAGQEHVDRPPYLPLVGIDDRGNGEAADVRVSQDLGQVLGVVSRARRWLKSGSW